MNMKKFLSSWEGTQSENRWNRVIIGSLLGTVILLGVKNFTQDTVAVIQPMTLTEEAWVSSKSASVSYQESWGLFLGTLLGNASPETAGFIRERIGPLLSPKIYPEVMLAINEQAESIRQDRVTMRFEPRYVLYEHDADRIYVYGNSFIKDTTTKESRSETTYEFQISIQKYQPVIEHMTVYGGKPRSERVLMQMQKRELKQAERESKR